ncbi:MAG: acyl-CoA thioesterase [Candidatus Nitrosocosmicus sp.]|nr:acyl-CoA thioesterase [Candidatus Nitrosocosmicus sp. SS]MDR4489298.1 acyl-CoA thioesterase [Candidatus Nitrosocosmicus sp.]
MTDEIDQNFPRKTVQESEAETTIVMLPSDANPLGNVFGGMILKYVDLLAGLVAKRHAGHANIVTASIDSMTFLKPVYIGNALILKARINYVRRSSMEVEVKIEAEDLNKSQKVHTGTAYVTLVALDEKGKPTEVPKLMLNGEEEEKRFKEGQERMESRLRSRKK